MFRHVSPPMLVHGVNESTFFETISSMKNILALNTPKIYFPNTCPLDSSHSPAPCFDLKAIKPTTINSLFIFSIVPTSTKILSSMIVQPPRQFGIPRL